MKKINNLSKQEIHLEGFGIIDIEERLDGCWHIDLFPRGSMNDREKIRIEQTFSSTSDKYFSNPKENKDIINKIYES